jgi:ATP-dependent DNA helicase RecG
MTEKGQKTSWNEIVQRESVRLEWKENVANPQNVVKTLCAFANDFQQVGGGRVIYGLREGKDIFGEPAAKVVGLDEKRLKEVKNKVLHYCHRFVEPPLTPEVSEYPVEDDPSRRILAFAVTSSQYAHRFRTKKDDVNYYIRVNDQTRPADGLIPQLLEFKKVWPPYLDQTHPDAGLDAIDLMALNEFLGRLELPQQVKEYLEPNVRFRGDVLDLVTYPPGRTDIVVPRNFTILLFGREPHRFFRGAYAIFSVYHGPDRASERSQRYEIFGPIPVLIRNLMSRLQVYMGIEIDRSLEIFSEYQNRHMFSEWAVQEAIVNAFIHRDYHAHDPVRVTLFNDRLEVISPGGPYGNVDPVKIPKGEAYTSWRNPSLAWFMVELKFAQNEGQGIRKIIELTKATSGKEPRFKIDSHWFAIEIPSYVPSSKAVKKETGMEEVRVAFDIKIELPAIRADFDDLREELADMDVKLEKAFDKIEESFNEVTGESLKKRFNKPLNGLRRFLKKLADENSEYNGIISGKPKVLETTRKLAATYNKFARWLALPEIVIGKE